MSFSEASKASTDECFRSEQLGLLSESFSPGRRKIFDLQGAAAQLVHTRLMQINAHGIGDRDAILILMGSDDFISRGDFSFVEDAQIKTAAAAGQETLRHVVATELQIQLETWESRLRYDYFRSADRKAIPEADFALQQTRCREVFTESAPGKIRARQFFLPVRIVLRGIDVHCFVAASVDRQIGLLISFEVQPMQCDAFIDRCFKNRRRDFPAVHLHRARNPYLNGN